MTMTATDTEKNREHIRSTTPVPPGWMATDNADPNTQTVMFWNSPLQVWSDVAATLNSPEEYQKFMVLWEAGSTFLIVPAPTPAPVPVPVPSPFPTFAAAPAPVPTPVAAPDPVPAVNLAVPPAFVPPAPVAAPIASFPVPPAGLPGVEVAPSQVVPTGYDPASYVPAPKAPAAVAPAIVVPPKKAAPIVVPTAKVAPVVAPVATPGAVVSGPSAPGHPKPELSPDALAAVQRLAKLHEAVSEQVKALAETEKALRAELVALAFPNGIAEGVNTCLFADKSALVVTGKVNRTVDPAKATSTREALEAVGVSFDSLFDWKPSLKVGEFKVTSLPVKALLADMVTEKEGTPSVELKKAKGV